MALRWRIRHKLLLGLSMVVGVIALLLVGTLQGLAAFTDTIKTSDTKIVQLHLAEDLQRAVGSLAGLTTDAQQTADEEETRFRMLLNSRAKRSRPTKRIFKTPQFASATPTMAGTKRNCSPI